MHLDDFSKLFNRNLYLLTLLLYSLLHLSAKGQMVIDISTPHFQGSIHDNISNEKRQGSGFNPLAFSTRPKASFFRDDAVGLNFEHIFNGAKAHHDISMFTPRRDQSLLRSLENDQFEIRWPAKGSKWGMEAKMIYDLSEANQIDMTFTCTPTEAKYPKGFVAMMWASYMNRAIDRRIHFWGTNEDRTGWTSFGEGTHTDIEVGTVAHAGTPPLPFEEGAQTLNLIEHTTKKFITPFYYGLLDADHNLETEDTLLYLVLFDQIESIRFAMWNFFKNTSGLPDTHSPAWDWQYVIRNPVVNQEYGYRARVVIKPYEGKGQIWKAYQKWNNDIGGTLPEAPVDK